MSKIVLAEQSTAPDTPGSGKVAVFVDSNGDLAWKDSAGNVNKIASAGGYTLTVPATGTAALLGTGNTFTTSQTISPTATDVVGLIVNNPSGATAKAMSIRLNGTEAWCFETKASGHGLAAATFDNGASIGPYISLGRNENGSTSASGLIYITDKGNTAYAIWPDDSGNLRIWTGDPIGSADTSGTVVGAQTSSLDSKDIAGAPIDIDDVLASVQAGADAVRRFTYRSGAFNGEEFSGLVTDYAPRYGMDRDAEHPAGKSLNVVTVIGDLLMAVANLSARVAALEAAE